MNLELFVNVAALIIVAVINYLGNRQTHNLVNSRMTELLRLTKENSEAAGVAKERLASDERAKAVIEATKEK